MRIKLRTLVAAAAVMIAGLVYLARGNATDEGDRDARGSGYSATSRSALQELIASIPTPQQLRVQPIYIESGTLRLEGQAIDGDEHPIAGATITLNGRRTTTSEGDGSFAFDNLAAADYKLTAEKDTYYGEDTLTLDATSEPLELKLASGPSIAVHVVAARGGAPVKDVRVEASGRVALTDGNGDARLRGLDSNGAMVNVTADGFASLRTELATGDDPKATIAHTITLQPGAALAGTVVDDAGKPVAKASVYVRAAGSSWRESVDSDEQGRWHVENFGPGAVTINATSDVHVATKDMLVQHDGVHAKRDIVVRVTRGATVSGLVVDSAGKPVADAQVSVTAGWGRSDANGKFDIVGLGEGELEVSAQLDSRGSIVQKLKLALGQHADVRITLVESSIAGIVVNTRGEPVEDVQIFARNDETSGGFGRTDEHGRFDLGGMAPGVYELIATRQKDRQDLPNGVKYSTGRRDVRLVIPDPAGITGRVVLDGKPVPYFGIVVHADPNENVYTQPDVVRSPDGRFDEQDMRPGRWAIAIVGPDFMRKDIPNVDITEGHTTDLGDIAVTRGRTIRGRVVDERGTPIAHAFVAAADSSFSIDDELGLRPLLDNKHSTHTDAAGTYELDGIPPDAELQLQASDAHGFAPPRKLLPGETDVDLVLSRTGSIDGTVTNARDGHVRAIVTPVAEIDAASQTMYLTNVEAGRFHFERLLPGEYQLELKGRTAVPPIRVTVTADAATHVAFELTSSPIDLAIHAGTCDDIILRTKGDERWLAFEQCHGGVAAFDDVTPGTYLACRGYGECGEITVAAQPQHQELTLVVAPKPPEPSADDPVPQASPPEPEPPSE